MRTAKLHGALEPISFLIGTWRGSGTGHYPTIDKFDYEEETRFWHSGRPFLFYMQRTWTPRSGDAMHTEMGYWRPKKDNNIEVVLAHSFGIVEVGGGEIDGRKITFESSSLTSTPTAKTIDAVARVYEESDDVLSYELKMAFDDNELQPHLGAELKRVTGTDQS
jgi:THAP domain-containing protein 4